MASNDPPQYPKERSERREQASRIAQISHRIAETGSTISASVRSVGDQIVTLANQIQTDNKATDIRDKNHQDRSFRWMKRGTWASIGLSALSLFISAAALYVVDKQLDTMRIEQRAWVKIAHKLQPIAENKPLIADITTINTGKTPAKRIEANFRVQKVRADRSPDLTASGINANSFIGILNPDASYPSSVPMMRDSGTILNPPLLTKSDVAEIASGESYIVVFGRLIYSDIYDTPHWINFCFWESAKQGTYHARECVEFNAVDNN